MAYKAKFWIKVRRWLGRRLALQAREARVVSFKEGLVSKQVGKLLSQRGSEIITMTTL